MKILACQIDIPKLTTVAKRDSHINNIVVKIRQCLAHGTTDLVVLPELCSINYSRAAFDNLNDLAEPLDGYTYTVFREVAIEYNVVIVYGIPRISKDGYKITQVAIGTDGLIIGHFDKLHIAQFGYSMEKEYYQRGDHLFVFEHKGVKIAPIICYDIRIPELTRALVINHGVELLLHCGAYGRDESFDSWHQFIVTRAIENQIYVLSLNRAGQKFGHSILCKPWVDKQNPPITFPEHDEAMISLDIDSSVIAKTREKYTFLVDRFDSYEDLQVINGR